MTTTQMVYTDNDSIHVSICCCKFVWLFRLSLDIFIWGRRLLSACRDLRLLYALGHIPQGMMQIFTNCTSSKLSHPSRVFRQGWCTLFEKVVNECK